MKMLFFCMFLALLTACNEVASVKLGSDFVHEEPMDQKGLVYLYWPNNSSLGRGSTAVEILINGKRIMLPVGAYAVMHLPPGKYPVSVNYEAAEVTVKEGERVYLEIQYTRKYSILGSAIARSSIYSGYIGVNIFNTHRVYLDHCKRISIAEAEKLYKQETGLHDVEEVF